MQQRGFAGAALADQGQALAGVDAEVEVGEDDEVGFAGAVGLGEVPRADDRFGRSRVAHADSNSERRSREKVGRRSVVSVVSHRYPPSSRYTRTDPLFG